MDSPKRLLIIEDDRDIAKLVSIHARGLGLESDHATDGRRGLDLALKGGYALVVLDLMLPSLDGLEVCKALRAEQPATPILVLTAKSEELDKVLGLELGADDYVTKPFGVRELTARMKALLRRTEAVQTRDRGGGDESVRIGGVWLDAVSHRVLVDDRPVDVTAKEFELLALFMRNPGRAFSRSQLLDLVWGYKFEGYDHTVNSHINRLRGKIEPDSGNPTYLRTVWGVGYRFALPEELPR